MPGLREMVRAEIARREEAAARFLPFTFTVHDDPAALTDVTAAVQAIEEERRARTDGVERRASPTTSRPAFRLPWNRPWRLHTRSNLPDLVWLFSAM